MLTQLIKCLAVALFALSLLTGCEPGQRSNTQIAPASQPSVPSTPIPAPTVAAVTDGPFTFPLLDALLSDKEFTNEVRTSLGVKDAEIAELKKAAADAMSELDENEGSDRSSGSNDARQLVKQLLGDDRGQRLIALVQQKWSSGSASEKPNMVPTDTRVVVNIPAFRMDVFNDGRLTKTYKIGIGYPEFPLPTGERTAKQIIVNPTWTPPDEPWVRGKVRPYEKVEAGSKLNPLGVVKIPIGGPSLIHGGKSAQRLGTFASHGCVGLTNGQVEDFAVQLAALAGEDLSLEDIKSYEKKRTETKTIDLPKNVPVELRYETIVLENGTLKIYRDVYERGTNTEENLSRVLQANGVSLDQLDEKMRADILAALNEMGTDATGKPIDGVVANSNANSTNEKDKKAPKITRNIKGQKEVSFTLSQLAGKGYPAPVNLRST